MSRFTAIIVASAALLGSGCCTQPRDDFTIEGTAPPLTDQVLAVARERCGRELRGSLRWVATREEVPEVADGHCTWDTCGMDAVVAVALDATCTGEAHEFGHYCLDSSDQNAVQAWANSVNAAVPEGLCSAIAPPGTMLHRR